MHHFNLLNNRALLDWDGFCSMQMRAQLVPSAEEDEVVERFTTVYPNPANGQLHISSTECMEKINLYNANGIEISTINLSEEQWFDIQFSSGIYILQITLCNGTIEMHKVIGN